MGKKMSTDSARTELMGKLRRASDNTSAEQIKARLSSLGTAPAPPLPGRDIIEAFLINVLKNQGSIDCATDRSSAVSAVARHLHETFRTRKLVVSNDSRLAAMPWRDGGVLPRFGAAEQGENASLSYAKLGVAETGSVVTYTGRENPAANNLLVEVHIVLLDVVDLMANLDDAWLRISTDMEKSGRPRGINVISGPSSTADISAQLVMGAHGPRGWHVILMGETPEAAMANARKALEHPPV